MAAEAQADLDAPRLELHADVRYHGQSFELTVPAEPLDDLAARFHTAHEQRYGYRMEGEETELVNLRLVAVVPVSKPSLRAAPPAGDPVVGYRRTLLGGHGGQEETAPVLSRARMGVGSEVVGPAIVEFAEATCLVRPGWCGLVDEVGTLVLGRS
jgi:N-methylhydantoinase A